ncbi:hypothetical protein CR513_45411, partial [Mucuna pruriens]
MLSKNTRPLNYEEFTPFPLPDCTLLLLLLPINACRLILLTIFFQLVTNRSSSQRVSVSTASMSSSISSPSCFKCPFLLLMICTTCSIFSGGKLCNPSPNLCFSSRLISLLLGSLAFGFGCFKCFTGGARIGDGVRTGDCSIGGLEELAGGCRGSSCCNFAGGIGFSFFFTLSGSTWLHELACNSSSKSRTGPTQSSNFSPIGRYSSSNLVRSCSAMVYTS